LLRPKTRNNALVLLLPHRLPALLIEPPTVITRMKRCRRHGAAQAVVLAAAKRSGRRTFATRLNAKGVGMRTIQKLMGHRHIGTTALYCDVSEDTLRNAVELV
jgi:site-specific recombinase XerD